MAGYRVDGWVDGWGVAGSLREQREHSGMRLCPGLKGSAVLAPEALRGGASNHVRNATGLIP